MRVDDLPVMVITSWEKLGPRIGEGPDECRAKHGTGIVGIVRRWILQGGGSRHIIRLEISDQEPTIERGAIEAGWEGGASAGRKAD